MHLSRRLRVSLVAMVLPTLVAACGRGATPAPAGSIVPTQAAAGGLAPTGTGAGTAAQAGMDAPAGPAGGAVASEFFSGVRTLAGTPPMARTDLRKLVRLPAGAILYRGPGEWYGEYAPDLPRELPYGVLWNGWLGVRLDRGLAWLPSAGRLEMTDQDGDGAEYVLEPGRRWALTASDALEVRVLRRGPGHLVLEVAGAPEAAGLTAYPDFHALYLDFSSYQPRRARLDIGEGGLRGLSIGPGGLLMEFDDLPGVEVQVNEPGLLRLELRPWVRGIQITAAGEDVVIGIPAQGELPPKVGRNGAELTLRLAGARLGGGVGAAAVAVPAAVRQHLPGDLRLSATEDGVTATVSTSRPHGLRRMATGLEWVLYRPGLAGKRIVVDPGHGGRETGTATPWGEPEKEINLAVSLILARQLAAAGAQVLLLRTGDSEAQVPEAMRRDPESSIGGPQREINRRAAIANWWGADALLSIHHNGGGAGSRGTEVYWYPNLNADRSEELARLTQDALLRALGTVDRGVIQRPFGMVRLPQAPSVLVEIGFLTHPDEARYLTAPATQERAAAAMVEALEAFFRAR